MNSNACTPAPGPAVSIILPVYDRAGTLSRAIRSAQAQPWTGWELIVVDDGSRDGSARVAEQLAEDDPRLVVLRRAHAGLHPSRNAGIAASRAPVITFLDSDDYYDGDHLTPCLEYLAAHPETGLVYGWTRILGDEYVRDARDPQQQIHIDDCMQPGTLFVRRTVLNAIGGYPADNYAGDYLLGERVRAAGFIMHRLPGRTYVYDRTGSRSITKDFGAAH
jgi:glycosyltransferase involved in cell wall biosynthesis